MEEREATIQDLFAFVRIFGSDLRFKRALWARLIETNYLWYGIGGTLGLVLLIIATSLVYLYWTSISRAICCNKTCKRRGQTTPPDGHVLHGSQGSIIDLTSTADRSDFTTVRLVPVASRPAAGHTIATPSAPSAHTIDRARIEPPSYQSYAKYPLSKVFFVD